MLILLDKIIIIAYKLETVFFLILQCPTLSSTLPEDHRRTAHGAEGGCSPLEFLQIQIFGPKFR